MSAAVAGTISRFRPTRSYTNSRDVTGVNVPIGQGQNYIRFHIASKAA